MFLLKKLKKEKKEGKQEQEKGGRERASKTERVSGGKHGLNQNGCCAGVARARTRESEREKTRKNERGGVLYEHKSKRQRRAR